MIFHLFPTLKEFFLWFSSFPSDMEILSQVITRPSVKPTYILVYYLLFSLPFNAVYYKVHATENIVKNYSTVGTKVIIYYYYYYHHYHHHYQYIYELSNRYVILALKHCHRMCYCQTVFGFLTHFVMQYLLSQSSGLGSLMLQ
jgi:hypothetical protein